MSALDGNDVGGPVPQDRPPDDDLPDALGRTRAACDILRFLSGQLDDGLIVTARRWVATGRVEDAVLSVVAAALTSNAELNDSLVLAAATLLDSENIGAALARTCATPETAIALRHDFSPADASAVQARTIGDMVSSCGGTVAVWCALRRPPLEAPWPPPRAVWAIEVEPSVDVARLTGALQDALAGAGTDLPIVEVRHVGEEPTSTEVAVTDLGELVWTRHGDQRMQIAPVFDFGIDGRGGFDLDHPMLEPDERERLAAYLRAGTTIRSMYSDIADVIDANAPDTVPIDLKTDGRWIWSDATRYYLERHGYAPAEAFLSHLRSVDGPLPAAVDSHTLRRALETVED